MRDSLEDEGYLVTMAADGLEAKQIILGEKPPVQPIDLIVSDIQMPKLTGLDLLDIIRERELNIPFVVTTGFGDKDMVVKLLRKGCLDYVDKPYTAQQVIDMVKNAFQMKEKEKQQHDQEISRAAIAKTDIEGIIQSYRDTATHLETQIHAAVDAYKNLINIPDVDYGVRICWKNRPLADLGGDFIDIRRTTAGCDIFIADVAGHDMGASYHTVLLKAFFDENCRTGNDGASFFQLLNKQLIANGKNERMVTAIFLRLNLNTMMAETVTAAHPNIVLCRKGEPVPRPILDEGPVLGIFSDVTWETKKFKIASGDRLLLYTDGICNASHVVSTTGEVEKLGVAGLDDVISKHINQNFEQMIENIWNEVLEYSMGNPDDDTLLFGVYVP